MRISIIGAGNVGTHMAAAFKNAGHRIMQVYSSSYHNAALLGYHVGAEATNDLADINATTDIFIIAVKDYAIDGVAEQLSVHNKLMVHTSGATELEVLSKYNQACGVFYPLQTFSKIKEVDFWKVPLCIEGSTPEITAQLLELAQTISNNVYPVDSTQRKILHLAAVFACNFTNNLYAIAQSILAEHGLGFELLRPLILETAEKVQENYPAKVQTGPAIRDDEKTMEAHLQLLQQQPELQQLYSTLSQSIIKMGFDANADK